ncbi:MAG: glycosyltransferase family 2 protein, partial [Eubacteriales bacterium]
MSTLQKREISLLSVVIPAYCEAETVVITARTVGKLLLEAEIPYEIIFVDDGSTDSTWEVITTANENDPHVRGVHFSRNFGKESAIFAGLSHSRGDCVAVIDCDLQHPPEKMIEMVTLWKTGYDVVEGVKLSRGKENPLHTFASKVFYHYISRATGMDMSNASDYKLLDRKVVEALLSMEEQNGFFRALSAWVGYSTVQVPFHVDDRVAGESKWS